MVSKHTDQKHIQSLHLRDFLDTVQTRPRLNLDHDHQVLIGVVVILSSGLDTGESVGRIQRSIASATDRWVLAVSHNITGILLPARKG